MKNISDLLSNLDENKGVKISNVMYCSDRKENEEYFEITIIDSKDNKKIIKSDKMKWLYNWNKMLELNIYEGETKVYDRLSEFSDLLSNYQKDKEDCNYQSIIKEYNALQKEFPFLLVILRDIYKLMSIGENQMDVQILRIDKRINILIEKLNRYIEYIFQSLIEPYENGKIIDPLRLLFGYEMFLSFQIKHSVLTHSVFYNAQRYGSFDEKESFLTMINEEGNILAFEMPEEYEIVDCYEDSDFDMSDDFYDEMIFDYFDDLFLSGIHYLIETEQIPKKCKLCGRYFLNKYSYVANYCNVLYKDTKDTCQEYVSKLNYKAKTAKNPINTEYSKVYNRIYSRVRRGSMEKIEAKFDELKRLRDEYLMKFEMVKQEEKQTMISKFAIDMERLYVTDNERERVLRILKLGIDQIKLFNAIAKDKTLDEFKESVRFHNELSYSDEIDDSQHKYIVENLIRIADNMGEKMWFEIQCVLPFKE